MSSLLQIRKISDITESLKICNIHKIELIEEYFNHLFNPFPHTPNPKTEYEFKYQLGATGKCEIPDCNRDAFCIMSTSKT